MNQQQREQIKNKIVAELARLATDVKSLEELTDPNVTDDTDEVTRMSSLVTKSVNAAALATLRQRVAGLDYALKRVNDDEFGYCIDCGEPIPLLRLLAMPETPRCIECAQ